MNYKLLNLVWCKNQFLVLSLASVSITEAGNCLPNMNILKLDLDIY